MNQSAKFPHSDFKELICKCGAKLRVKFVKQDGHNEGEEFLCPNCQGEHKVSASQPVLENDVRLSAPISEFLQISGRLSRIAQLFDNLRQIYEKQDMGDNSEGPTEARINEELDEAMEEVKNLMANDLLMSELYDRHFRSLLPSMRHAVRSGSARQLLPFRDALKRATNAEHLKKLLDNIPVS